MGAKLPGAASFSGGRSMIDPQASMIPLYKIPRTMLVKILEGDGDDVGHREQR